MEIIRAELCRSDDDAFFVLVDGTCYSGFVDEDWTLEQLLAHVAEQAALGRIAAVHLGPHLADLPVEVRGDRSARDSLREVSAVVEVRGEGLDVISYSDVTMAAQFEDAAVVPTSWDTAQVRLHPGRYRVTFRQLRDDTDIDDDDFWESEEPALEVVVEPTGDDVEPVPGGIAWFEV